MAEYRSGTSTANLAKAFGIHRKTVVAHLRRQGVRLRRDRLEPESIQSAIQLYDDGWSLARIAARFGTTANPVRAVLVANGVEMSKPWERPTGRPD
ncbi:hypothetical protein [Janibacter massiliensis]|uniref:hypothetical protein n=1 Tax=Janibacter massiliensis TaxID=2058291 RepID=UPI00131A5146|nr:hypothetical protein [Janibacter massiliensis]